MSTTYRHTDSNAPTLDDSTGSLIALLKACLVDGYTGKTAAGWTVEYESGNVAVFRGATAGGTGAYFRVDDSVGAFARFRAYSSMSDVDTGVDPSPTMTYWTDGLPIRKTRNDTGEWIIVADEHTCYFQTEDSELQGFGDFESFVPGDAFNYFIAGSVDSESIWGPGWGIVGPRRYASTSDGRGAVVGKGADQTSDPPEFGIPRPGDYASGSTATPTSMHGGTGGIDDPDPATGLRFFAPAFVACEGTLRGRLRGLYVPLNDLGGVANGTIESAAAGLPVGSQLMILRCVTFPTFSGRSDDGRFALETGLDW